MQLALLPEHRVVSNAGKIRFNHLNEELLVISHPG